MTAGTSTTTQLTSGRKIAVIVLAILVPLLVVGLLAEGVLRLFGTRSPVIDAGMLVQRQNPIWPYALRPGYRGSYGGGWVTVGGDGNRIVPLPPGGIEDSARPRVVILGDSVAFGQGVDDEQTVAARMQADPAWGKDHRAMLVAAPGYTSWNEFAALSAANLTGVKTVLLVYVSNDIMADNDHFKLGDPKARLYGMERDPFHKFTRFLYDHSRLFYIITDSIKKIGPVVRAERSESPSPAEGEVDQKNLAYSMEAIAKIRNVCRERGINFLVAIYSDGNELERPAWVTAYDGAVSAALENLGVDYFIPRAAHDRLTARQFSTAWNDSRHLSVEASVITAREFIDELARRGM